MKKVLLLSVCLMAAMPAFAQKGGECALSAFQMLISNIRDVGEIQDLIAKGVPLEEQVRCGGSLMQLAIRRGNPQVLEAMLRQDQRRANGMVALDAFPIAGAPKQIPLILFAAYYAPNKDMVELLMAAGANVTVTDDYGRNVLWYLGKNPVLKNTKLQDELNQSLLYGSIAQANAMPAMGAPTGMPAAAPATQTAAAQSAPNQNAAPMPTSGLVAE